MVTSNQFIPESILHEKQSLQLCAVHAVNNLLQTRHDEWSYYDDFNHVDATHEFNQSSCESSFTIEGSYVHCAGGIYRRNRELGARASKREFDGIADELHGREVELLSQGSNWMKINHHRSILTGNYSFEVSNK